MAESAPQFASLYVGDLHSDVTEAMLYEIFNAVGPVASIRVCRDSIKRRSLGYAYVNFHTVSDAERALDTLNYSSIRGRSCRIMWSQRDPSSRKSNARNIYVKNLDRNIDNKALYDTFSLFGSILSCKVASDSEGNSHGYGFVDYETEEAAQQAIERVNGMQIGEQTVQVSRFQKREDRPRAEVTHFTNLYIKGFPEDWDEEKVREEMGQFGPIKASALKTDKRGRKMAFIDFEATEDAQKCVAEMHMKEMRSEEALAQAKEDGKEDEAGPDGHPVGKLFVQRVVSKQEREQNEREEKGKGHGKKSGGVNLYIKNLDESADDASLRALFEQFGSVTSAAAPRDERGKSKGYGFVCFASPEEATNAVTEMHLKVVQGKPLYVGLAEKREERQERLRLRYTPGAMPGPGGKGPGGGKGKGKGGGFPGMMPGLGLPGPMPGSPMGMFGKGGPPPMMGMLPQPMMGMMRPGMMPQAMMGMGGMGMLRPGMMPGGMVRPLAGGMVPQGGMMRPPMAAGARPVQQRPPMQPLSASTLAAAPPSVQKQMIGERLYMLISRFQPELAAKITGMMLEMDNGELLMLLESEPSLRVKVDEALKVLSKAK